MEELRLNKYLSDIGVCSRREADRLIQAGKVLVDGKRAVMGMKVCGNEKVICDGKTVRAEMGTGESADSADGDGARPPRVLLAVNKPRGVVCTTSDKDRAENIVEMVNYPVRVYPAGRLDKDSEGLIFLTNQGELVNQMMRGANGHEKEYVVWVDKPLTKDFVKKMEAGVCLEELGVTTRPCKVTVTGSRQFRIILTQGLNRQIRRMCETFGYHVRGLRRIRIMNVELGDLRLGTWRQVTREEYETLTDMLGETPGNRDGKPENRAGRPGNRDGRLDRRNGRPENRAGRPGNRRQAGKSKRQASAPMNQEE